MDDCHEGAKRIAQQLRQLHDIDRDPPRLILLSNFAAIC
jgi:hypothetical protein